MNIPREDVEFIRLVLLPWSGVRAVYITWSSSTKKYPDIWLSWKDGTPMITLTEEWRSHGKHLRRSQLVHEFLHTQGLDHGKIGEYDYNTHPELDTYSKHVYRSLI